MTSKTPTVEVPSIPRAPEGAFVSKPSYDGSEEADALAKAEAQAIEEANGGDSERSKARQIAMDLLASKEHRIHEAKPLIPEGVWTMEQMEEAAPIQADLYGDGRFLFWFLPILGNTDIQSKFRRAKKIDEKTGEGVYELMKGWASVLKRVLTSWPFMEVVTEVDEETGEEVPVYEPVPGAEEDPETGEVEMQVRLKPLPITQNNCERLPADKARLMFTAMERALSGEGEKKPS